LATFAVKKGSIITRLGHFEILEGDLPELLIGTGVAALVFSVQPAPRAGFRDSERICGKLTESAQNVRKVSKNGSTNGTWWSVQIS